MNDQSIWNQSKFGKSVCCKIPIGTHILGDGGYALRPWLMTPFKDSTKNIDEYRYNKIHSQTRINIEIAFGWLKNRFRIFQQNLSENTVQNSVNNIIACMTLHNIYISVEDTEFAERNEHDIYLGQHYHLNNDIIDDTESTLEQGIAKRKYLMEIFIK